MKPRLRGLAFPPCDGWTSGRRRPWRRKATAAGGLLPGITRTVHKRARGYAAGVALLGACTGCYSNPISIQAAQSSVVATPCVPVAPRNASGLLEVDPLLNPGASYVLVVEASNDLAATPLTTGVMAVPESPNDFRVRTATASWAGAGALPLATETLDTPIVVRAGGPAFSTTIGIPLVSRGLAFSWFQALQASGTSTAKLLIHLTLSGQLGSGQSLDSTQLDVPLTVCRDCGGVSLPDTCGQGSVLAPTSSGPCCAAQDFQDACIACGSAAQPCCGATDGGQVACEPGLTCSGGVAAGVWGCGYPFSPTATCAAP